MKGIWNLPIHRQYQRLRAAKETRLQRPKMEMLVLWLINLMPEQEMALAKLP